MKIRQIITACVLAAGIILATSGCSTPKTALTVDGQDVPAGVYIYTQQQALQDALALFHEQYPDVDDNLQSFNYSGYTLDGKPWKTWITDRAVELCAERVAWERMFAEMNLVMSDGDYQEVNDIVSANWTTENENLLTTYNVSTLEQYYSVLGVSESSVKHVLNTESMRIKLFDAIYAQGGSEAVPEADLKAKFSEDYARIRVISMPLTGSDGNIITDAAELDELKTKANEYLDRLANGETFSAVYDDSYAYLTEQSEETSETSEDDGTQTAENSDGSEAVEAAAEEVDEDYEETFDQMVDLNGVTPSEGMVTAMRAASIGTPMLYEDTDAYYVFVRLDIGVRTDWFESYRSTLLHAMKDTAFEEKITQKAAALTVVRDEQALAIYDPDKQMIMMG
jgi:hypothetical protein